MSKSLTDALIRNAITPKTGSFELADAGCRGLSLRVTANGVRSFAFRFRSAGRSERLSIGKYPDLSLRDARARADELRREVAAGRNPSATKRAGSERTFEALANRYLEEHARRFKRSAYQDERTLRVCVLPHWKGRDYTTIERSDVIRLVERIVSSGTPVMANRTQALISAIFSFAIDSDLLKAHPSLRLRKRGQEIASTRTLSDDELRLFWKYAPARNGLGAIMKLILLTGARPGEVAGMAKAELEFDAGGTPVSWLIPGERTKNGRAHLVPLSPLSAELVAEALRLSRNSNFVFPAKVAAKGAIARHSVTFAMKRMAAKFSKSEPGATSWVAEPPTPHDLRRTCATRMSAAGISSDDVAAVLAHTRGDITGRHYDHYGRAAEKTRALGRWSQILAAILEPPAPNVVHIGTGAR